MTGAVRQAPGLHEEKAAHRFAGAFLAPTDVLRAKVGANRSSLILGELVALKKQFGGSLQALAYRCKYLGIFSQAAFAKLFEVFAERGWRA
jgi:Zn-dependent peptidase ImmA (M78 family)